MVPASSEKIGSVTVVAEGPGPIRAELSEPVSKPGMYTWVWEVLAEDQPAEFLPWIEAGWSDTFGLADETTSVRYPGKIDSALSIRQTKSGTYLGSRWYFPPATVSIRAWVIRRGLWNRMRPGRTCRAPT